MWNHSFSTVDKAVNIKFQKVNDTKSAFNQIGTIVNDSFPPDAPSTTRPISVTTTTTASSVSDGDSTSPDTSANTVADGVTTTTTTTTTETPKLTRNEIQGIIRRNVKGLIRLFNIEWQDALSVRFYGTLLSRLQFRKIKRKRIEAKSIFLLLLKKEWFNFIYSNLKCRWMNFNVILGTRSDRISKTNRSPINLMT